ncbi:MAG: hypothetical protein K1W16_03115 [Lachnospiraceae bacterium]
MNIFELPKYQWLDYMERIIENIGLSEISIIQNSHMIFEFLSCYNGKLYAHLECSGILKCCIESQAHEDEEFTYFIADIFVKELNKDEMESSLKYYKYGYNVNLSQVHKLYLVSIIGSFICLDIICEKFGLTKVTQ